MRPHFHFLEIETLVPRVMRYRCAEKCQVENCSKKGVPIRDLTRHLCTVHGMSRSFYDRYINCTKKIVHIFVDIPLLLNVRVSRIISNTSNNVIISNILLRIVLFCLLSMHWQRFDELAR